MSLIWSQDLKDDPLAFVMTVFPWGKKGTPLEHEKGPRKWQEKKLKELSAHIKANRGLAANGQPTKVLWDATSSGRGIGKSSMTAWLVLWMLSTKLGSTTIITANTEAQLKSRTMAELGKWLTLAINAHWFEPTVMSIKPSPWFEDALKKQLKVDTGYYYAQAQLWSEEKPDAFAGAHNPQGMLVIFDEASGIPEAIWNVSKGFFTEKKAFDRYWFAFSNPRRNTGAFFECFHKNRKFWNTTKIDARTVEDTDTMVYDQIIEEKGLDSYEARVEVLGEFPTQGVKQFISRSIVQGAVERELIPDPGAPLIMGVDPARFGDDSTVIRFRRGRDARSIQPIKLRSADNMQVVAVCAKLISDYNPDAVCIDVGNGAGIIDRLRELGYRVHEVGFGTAAEDKQWANKRTELWARMREWLNGGCIDRDDELIDDLSAPEYRFQGQSDRQMLEPKEEMKRRGHSSPDNADALACTFAVKLAHRDLYASKSLKRKTHVAKDVDYPIF